MNISKDNVSISIVNWNGLQYLEDCLCSIYKQDYKAIKEVILVDNASSDGSLGIVERKFPQVKCIKNSTNLGFSVAHNQTISISQGDFILIMNFDIILTESFISKMVEAIEKDNRIGIVSGKLYKIFNNKKSNILDTTGITMRHYFPMARGEMEEDTSQYDVKKKQFIFGACGAASLFRKKMLEDIKFKNEYFDEDFVNYVEDVDLSWRAQLRGWKVIYEPRAVAYHERGFTRKENKEMQRDYYTRGYTNRYLTIYKNITKQEFKKIFFKFFIRELVGLITRYYSIPPSIKFKVLKKISYFHKKFKEKRRYIQSRIVINPDEITYFFEYDKFNFLAFILKKLKRLMYKRINSMKFNRQ